MSKVDEELSLRLRSVERPIDLEGLFEGLERRRANRRRVRRIEIGALAVIVFLATAGGFLALSSAFRDGHEPAGADTPYGAAGAIVACTDASGTHLCRIDADALAQGAQGRDLVPLTDVPNEIVSMPSVSSDGTTVVFDRSDPAENATSLWTIDVAGKDLRRLSSPGSGLTNASWGPDRSLVAVAAAGVSGDGPAALAILDPARSPDPVVRTIPLPGLVFPSTPRFSPDGSLIMFTAGEDRDSTATHVYTVMTDGTNLTRRTGSVAWTPDWSPDGTQIVFGVATGDGEELHVCPLDCPAPRRLEDPSGQAITGGLPRWSPDGGWISFQTVERDGDSAIQAVRVDGSDARILASQSGEMAWITSPLGPISTVVTNPQPTPSEGSDIGLELPMCDLEVLEHIDWDGTGVDGTAWTGAPVDEDGSCRSAERRPHIVAVDRDGDGVAERGSTWTLGSCLLCRPYDTVDLSDDGVRELVVLEEASSTPDYAVFEVSVSERAPGVYPILVVPPGAPAMNLLPGEQLRLTVGGDEAFSGGIRCIGQEPVIEYTWANGGVDVTTDLDIDVVRFVITPDGAEIRNVDEYSIPLDAPDPIARGPQCGVNWYPAP